MDAHWNGTAKSSRDATDSGLNLNALGKIHSWSSRIMRGLFSIQKFMKRRYFK